MSKCLPMCQDVEILGEKIRYHASLCPARWDEYKKPAEQPDLSKCDCGAHDENTRTLARTGPGEGVRIVPHALNCAIRSAEQPTAPQVEEGGK